MERIEYVASRRARSPGSAADGRSSAAALAAFGTDLYAAVSGGSEPVANLVCSPYSVAMALAMTREGARGRTAEEMTRVLHAANRYAAGLGWLDQHIGAGPGGGTVSLQSANALWGQRGTRWRPAFLDALAADFGTGMHGVDFERSAERARTAVNAWTAEHTAGRIVDLLAPRSLDATTRLVLVDAIRLEAAWATAFAERDTQRRDFTRRDSSTVRVPMMAATLPGGGFAEGPTWRAGRVPYAGFDLAMALVVPRDGHHLDEVEGAVASLGLDALLAGFEPASLALRLPRWTARTAVPLADPLASLGMPLAFSDAADFSGLTASERLRIDAVEHQAWIAVDEDGTEAAAATAVVAHPLAARAPEPGLQVYADRPFLYVIHHVATGTPLFVGRVDDPSLPAD